MPSDSLIYQWVQLYVTHWSFSSHLLLINTRGLCRLLHHQLSTSSQQFINRTSREIGQLCLDAHLPTDGNMYTQCTPYTPEGFIQDCSIFNFFINLFIIILLEFLKVWTKHKFYYIQYISVYIQPRYLYLIFKSVNANNINRVILHSVRPLLWQKWGLQKLGQVISRVTCNLVMIIIPSKF